MNTTTTRRNGAIGVAVAGLLMAIGGGMHPRADTTVTFDEGLARMFESSAWTLSHGLTMAGYAVLAVALTLLLRTAGTEKRSTTARETAREKGSKAWTRSKLTTTSEKGRNGRVP